MTQDEQLKQVNKLFTECLETLKSKGHAYASDNDILANFKRNAERCGTTKYQTWLTYFCKHVDSVFTAIKDNPISPSDKSEGMHGRIMDAVNYLLILDCLLIEDEKSDKVTLIKGKKVRGKRNE